MDMNTETKQVKCYYFGSLFYISNRDKKDRTEKINNQGSGTKPLSPDKDSKRSKRRKSRGFSSLEKSSRKHRRSISRIYTAPSDSAFTQKGVIKYHN